MLPVKNLRRATDQQGRGEFCFEIVTPPNEAGARSIALVLLAAVVAFLACYFRFFVFPGVPILPHGDQVIAVTDGARVAAGQLPYRDFFSFLPPGSALTYGLLVKVFGLRTWIPGLSMCFLAAGVAFLITLASSRMMRGWIAIMPALLFTGFILLGGGNATHHWFSTILILAAMLLLFGNHPALPRIALAGMLCGAAACYTQTKGAAAVVAFVLYLLWKSRSEGLSTREVWTRCLAVCLGALLVFAVVNAYFIAIVGLRQWIYCLVLYPVRYYPAPAVNNWRILLYDLRWNRSVTNWIAFPFVYCTVPWLYLFFLFFGRHGRDARQDTQTFDHLNLVALTGLSMFLAVAPSPSLFRLSTVSPPAMILLSRLLWKSDKSFFVIRAVLATLAVGAAIALSVSTQTRKAAHLELPAGRTALTDQSMVDEYRWISAHTHPGQFFWGVPTLYLPFQLINPARIEELDASEYTRPEEVSALINALEQHKVPMIIIPSPGKYFSGPNTTDSHLGPFLSYLENTYRLKKTFASGDEVWVLADRVSTL